MTDAELQEVVDAMDAAIDSAPGRVVQRDDMARAAYAVIERQVRKCVEVEMRTVLEGDANTLRSVAARLDRHPEFLRDPVTYFRVHG